MKGRKPQANAIRRGRTPADVLAVRAEPEDGLGKPVEVESNPDLSALWDTVVGSGSAYRAQDGPILTQLVYWMDVARTCREAMTAADGRTIVTIGEDGRTTPYFAQMEKATSQILRLSDQLGCTPLARARIGITETAAQSMQVDIAQRIRALMDEREARP